MTKAKQQPTEREQHAQRVLANVLDILNASDPATGEPAGRVVAVGEALAAIGKTLDGIPLDKCQRIIRAAAAFHGIEI